jgi:hypothetical protein
MKTQVELAQIRFDQNINPQKKKYRDIEVKIVKLKTRFNDDEITEIAFVHAISYLLMQGGSTRPSHTSPSLQTAVAAVGMFDTHLY